MQLSKDINLLLSDNRISEVKLTFEADDVELKKLFIPHNSYKQKLTLHYYNDVYEDRNDNLPKDAKSNHKHLRKIINEEEVKNYLIKKGFSIIALSDFSFSDQINLFSNAKQIVGLHGAGFANLIFSKPGTLVIEIKSEVAAPVIGNLAKKVGLNFKEISIKPEKNLNNDQQGLIYVPLKDLDNKLINTQNI